MVEVNMFLGVNYWASFHVKPPPRVPRESCGNEGEESSVVRPLFGKSKKWWCLGAIAMVTLLELAIDIDVGNAEASGTELNAAKLFHVQAEINQASINTLRVDHSCFGQ